MNDKESNLGRNIGLAVGLGGVGGAMWISNILIRKNIPVNIVMYERLGEKVGDILFLQGGDLGGIIGAVAQGMILGLEGSFIFKSKPQNREKWMLGGAIAWGSFISVVAVWQEIKSSAIDIPDTLVFSVPLTATAIYLSRRLMGKSKT